MNDETYRLASEIFSRVIADKAGGAHPPGETEAKLAASRAITYAAAFLNAWSEHAAKQQV